MRSWIMAFAALAIMFSIPVRAEQEINYQALEADGFGEVADLLKAMTPAQRKAILEQAAEKQKELEKMTPEQRDALYNQMRATSNTIDVRKIDPTKLDPSKSKSTADIQKDMHTFNQKYKQGKISNDVIKPNQEQR